MRYNLIDNEGVVLATSYDYDYIIATLQLYLGEMVHIVSQTVTC